MTDLAEVVGAGTGGERVRLRIRIRPGQEPQVVEAAASTTVGELEEKIARKLSLNPSNVRLHFNNEPLPRRTTVAEVRGTVGDGVIEAVPSHYFGAEKTQGGGDSPSSISFLFEETQHISVPEVNRVYIDERVFGEMLSIFVRAALAGREDMCLLTGRAENGIVFLTTLWPAKTSHASAVSVEPDTGWLNRAINEVLKMGHNVVVEAHRHPIGAAMSGADRNSLHIMSTWLKPAGILLMIACCDIEFAVYREDESGNAVKTKVEVWPEQTIEVKSPILARTSQDTMQADVSKKRRSWLGRLFSFFKKKRKG